MVQEGVARQARDWMWEHGFMWKKDVNREGEGDSSAVWFLEKNVQDLTM